MTLAVLDTTRLLLRQLKETDVSAIYSLRSNEQVNQFIDRPTAKDPEEAKAFMQKITENKSYYWGITLKENGKNDRETVGLRTRRGNDGNLLAKETAGLKMDPGGVFG
jgi:RimJ/RimL family protein N-acetyltransferase